MKNKNTNKSETEGVKNKASFFKRHMALSTFLISFFVCIIVFGAIVFAVLNSIAPKSQTPSSSGDQQSSETSSSAVKKPALLSASDSFTMLTAVYAAKDGAPTQFILYRLDTTKKRSVVLSLPLGLYINNSTLADTYTKGGMNAVSDSVSDLISKKIDYTASVDSLNFVKIFNTLGGIYYNVPKRITYTMPDDNTIITVKASAKQYLNGSKIYALIGYYSNSEKMSQRCSVQTDIMKEFLSEKLNGYYIDHSDTYFSDVFNLVNTNFSMNDLVKRSDALKTLSVSNSIVVPPVTFVAIENPSPAPSSSSSKGSSTASSTSSFFQPVSPNPVDKTHYRISSRSALNGYF